MRLKAGDSAPDFSVVDVFDKPVKLENYRGKKLLICFLRYAGCPFCALVLLEIVRRYKKYEAEGLNIIAFFQSPKESVLKYPGSNPPPFPLIADPEKKIYDLYRVESSFAGFARGLINIPSLYRALVEEKMRQGKIDGDMFLMPAFFLIEPDAIIYKAYYGADFSDAIPFFDIEEFLLFSEPKLASPKGSFYNTPNA